MAAAGVVYRCYVCMISGKQCGAYCRTYQLVTEPGGEMTYLKLYRICTVFSVRFIDEIVNERYLEQPDKCLLFLKSLLYECKLWEENKDFEGSTAILRAKQAELDAKRLQARQLEENLEKLRDEKGAKDEQCADLVARYHGLVQDTMNFNFMKATLQQQQLQLPPLP